MNRRYCLVTPARNEARFIGKTLTSVAAQTIRPLEWIVVDDGSTDATAALVEAHRRMLPFLRLIHANTGNTVRDFSSKAFALQEGYEALTEKDYDYICFCDADISFGPGYFETLMATLEQDPHAGLVGGLIHEPDAKGNWHVTHMNPSWCVGGAAHFFRRACFEQVGGYPKLPRGGEDTVVEYRARAHGWGVYVVRDAALLHHKPSVVPRHHAVRAAFRMGEQEYLWGSTLAFEAVKSAARAFKPPYLIGGISRFIGYLSKAITGAEKDVDEKTVELVRSQQRKRLSRNLGTAIFRWRETS